MHYFQHMWFVNGQNMLYEGHITSLKCSSKSKITKFYSFLLETWRIWRRRRWRYNDTFCILGRFHYWRFVCRWNRFLDAFYSLCVSLLCVKWLWFNNLQSYVRCMQGKHNRHNFFLPLQSFCVHYLPRKDWCLRRYNYWYLQRRFDPNMSFCNTNFTLSNDINFAK